MLIVYGKEKTAKKFKAMDMSLGQFVSNLIYATMFQEEQREELQKEIDYMNKYNPDMVFEIRSHK